MSKNGNCKRLKLQCSKLKKKCNSKLGAVLGKSKSAKKCKEALKGNLNKKVNEFCTKTCKTCSKLSNTYFLLEFHKIWYIGKAYICMINNDRIIFRWHIKNSLSRLSSSINSFLLSLQPYQLMELGDHGVLMKNVLRKELEFAIILSLREVEVVSKSPSLFITLYKFYRLNSVIYHQYLHIKYIKQSLTITFIIE